MSGTTYAQVIDGAVVNVIEASADFIAQLEDSASYIQVFSDATGEPEKRFNYPQLGDTYDQTSDAFYSPTQPYPSWSLSAEFKWQAPTPMPDDGQPYWWDEDTLAWVEITPLITSTSTPPTAVV